MAAFFEVTPAYLMGWESDAVFTVEPENSPLHPVYSYQSKSERIKKMFRCLNEAGQSKAIEHLELLIKIPEYKAKAENITGEQ